MDNKLLYLVLANQVSRIKILLSQYILIGLAILFNIIISVSLIIFFGYFLTDAFNLILRLNLAFFIYSFVSSLFLMSFILLLLLFSNIQFTTIICTLLISITFLSNIPRQFIESKESQGTIKFNYNNGQIYKISDLYDSFDLQKYVLNYKIKYPYLSYAINNFMVNENEFTKEEFILQETINKRINNFWNKLGVIENQETIITGSDLKIKNLPVGSNLTDLREFRADDAIEVELYLENTFISKEKLLEMIISTENTNLNLVLKDLSNFLENIENSLPNFQQFTSDYFEEFIFVNETKSKIYKDSKTKEAVFKKDYLTNLYKYNLNASASLQSGFTLKAGVTENTFVKNKLFFPLMLASRVLEEYFINYTSKYIVSTKYSVDTENDGWSSYSSSRSKFDLYNNINLFNGIWNNYTELSGFSYEDFWFKPGSKSKIDLNNQKNMFLNYSNYTFKINEFNIIDKNSYSYYTKPWIYLAIQSVITILFMTMICYRYSKFDLS
ncbi:hypothetical protein [Spiroplasma cantharicola]|nr:hypothetical protein [Spiroplasma cantharicola]